VVLSLLTFVTDDLSLPAFRIDIGLVLAFVALVQTGPVGSLIVLAIPELIRPLVERHPVRRIATLTNLASFAWIVVVGQALLVAHAAHEAGVGRLLADVLAAAAMAVVNVVIIRAVLGVLADRVVISSWQMEARSLVATLVLAPFAALTAYLIPTLGILALVAAAAAAMLPGALVQLVTWTPRAGGLTVSEARSRYAAALGSRMELSRSQRRVLLAATRTSPRARGTTAWLSSGERDRVAKTLILAGLWSRSDDARNDCFSRMRPAEMGIESRVLVVAHGWAELTAMGTEQLEHRLALLTLHNNPDRYDRRIVALARDLIPEPDRVTARARVPHARELPRRIAHLKTAV